MAKGGVKQSGEEAELRFKISILNQFIKVAIVLGDSRCKLEKKKGELSKDEMQFIFESQRKLFECLSVELGEEGRSDTINQITSTDELIMIKQDMSCKNDQAELDMEMPKGTIRGNKTHRILGDKHGTTTSWYKKLTERFWNKK
ncbi:MAG: hypothetical protein MHMPM18_003467 [Marteilia pararefringens]